MAITLLPLSSGGVSLEFVADDLATVRARIIERFGPYEAEPWIDGAFLTVDGKQLVFTDDWDRPCLLATTTRGHAVLRALAEPLAVAAE